MQRFKFSLEKILSYREQLLSREKNNLRQLQAAKAQLMQRRDELESKQLAEGKNLQKHIAVGMTVVEIQGASYVIESSRNAIKSIETDIAQLEPAIEKQRTIVVKASQDVTVLEKLKAKQLEEYNADAGRAEQAQTLEFITNALVINPDEEVE